MNEQTLKLTPRRVRSAERRTRIAAVATDLISEQGFENFSVNDLATRLEMSVGGVYRYITTKTDLLVMVCEGIYDGVRDELGEIAAGAAPVSDKLVQAVDAYLLSCENKSSHITMMYREYRRLPEDSQEFYKRREQAIIDVFVDLIRAGIRTGEFRSINATVLAVDIVFLGHAPAFKWWALSDAVGSAELRREQVELIMSRLRPPASGGPEGEP